MRISGNPLIFLDKVGLFLRFQMPRGRRPGGFQTLQIGPRGTNRAVELALTGVVDGRIVNVVDDAPTTLYEMASLVGSPIEQSAEPLTDPWMGRMDGSRLRSLGFQPKVPTLYQAAQQGIL